MKSKFVLFIKKYVSATYRKISTTRVGKFVIDLTSQLPMENIISISHGNINLKFPVPNNICQYRIRTFSTKEPETLDWIDSIPEGSILWDVGANIGLYSVYAAKKRGCKVYAFEPSLFNLELLARSSFINNVIDNVCIVPLALSNQMGPSKFYMTATTWGGALSTFRESYGFDGNQLRDSFSYTTFGLTMVEAVEKLQIPQPDYIKLDVDGIEHLILLAGIPILKNIQGILVEVNDDFSTLAQECEFALKEAGLVFKEKLHSDIFEGSESYGRLYNQIWYRPQK